MEKRKTLKTTSQWIRTMHRGFVWTVLKNEKIGNVGTDYFVQRWIPYGWNESWNGSRKQGKQKSTLASRRQAAESDMASPEEQNDRWCVTGAHWLIDTWHLKAKSMASHARQIKGYHRKTQKNTEKKTQKFMILGFLEQIHHFLHLSVFLRSKKIWTDLKCIFVP